MSQGIAVNRIARPSGALVAAYLDGERDASSELVQRYRPRLVRFVSRMIGDHDRAEDLVQDAFVRVFRHLHRFDRTRKFSTWVYTIASNLARNELRNRKRSPLVLYQTLRGAGDRDAAPIEFEDHAAGPDLEFARRHLRELVDQTVSRLPEHQRAVFSMRELEGRSYDEIAQITGVNLGTVKSRLNRARRSFAGMIEPYID